MDTAVSTIRFLTRYKIIPYGIGNLYSPNLSKGTSIARATDVPSEKPTLKLIAKMLSLGVTTVSRALKDGPEISIQTRDRVKKAADEIGYKRDPAGVRLKTGKTDTIALVIDTEEEIGNFVSELIFGIHEELSRTNYNLIVAPYSRNGDVMKPIKHLVDTKAVDGVIITRIEPKDARVQFMIDSNMPFVTHGRTDGSMNHPYLDFDNSAFASLAVRRLAGLGRKRIAMLLPPPNLSFHNHLFSAFRMATTQCNLDQIPFNEVTNDNTVDAIRRSAYALFVSECRPDGFVCASGGVSGTGGSTFAIIEAAEKAGLVIGKDIDIIAKQLFRNLPLVRRQLYVVREDVRDTGRGLANLLCLAIAGQNINRLQQIFVPVEVIDPEE